MVQEGADKKGQVLIQALINKIGQYQSLAGK
jgi:hypothetical protein